AYASRDISLSAAQAYPLDPARTLADTLRGARAGPRNRAVAAHEGCKCAQRRGGAERPFNRASGTTLPGCPIPGAAMKSHRCSLNDPPGSESSANRESECGLRSALVGRAHRDKAGPITRNRIIIFGGSVHPRFERRWKSFAINIDRIGRATAHRARTDV